MKMFLLLVAVSLTASEKLDRTYLPPPGAKLSGGMPGNIEVPFEFPKESYTPPLRSQGTLSNRPVTPEDTGIEIGTNRGLGSQVPGFNINMHSEILTPGSNVPFDFQKVPTTTTSYAFTQTTTHPTVDGFDTTLGPINIATGFPTTRPFVDFSTSAPGFINFPQNQGQQIVPGYQPPNLVAHQSGLQSPPGIIQTPGSTAAVPTPDGQFVSQNRPGFIQGDLNQYQNISRPHFHDISANRPSFDSRIPGQNLNQYQLKERPGISNIGQQSTIAPNSSQGTTTFAFPQYGGNLDRIQVTSTPGTNIYSQGTTPSLLPSTTYDGTIQNVPNSNIPQSILPSGQQVAQGIQSGNINQLGHFPMRNQNQLNKDGKTVTNVPQTLRPGQQHAVIPQQYPSQINQSGRPIPGQDQIFPTVSSTTPVPNYSQFSTTIPSIFPSTSPAGQYQSSPAYPGTSGHVQPGFISRPERPQAESDRNAVILNYDNVITPEGYFSYSYDTSNGIHADESGNSADGVRANGSYSYIGDDGKVYSVVYTADENGFQPRGDHLPTPPPIPEAIQKVIEQVSKDKEAGVSDDGTYNEAKYGHKKFEGRRRPLKPNKTNIEESTISDTNESQFDEIDRKQQVRPHTGSKKPVPSKVGTSDKYDETINEQDQLSSGNLDNQEKEHVIGKIPTRRPVSAFPGQKEDKYTADYIAGDSDDRRRPFGKIPSRRPTLKPEEGDSLGVVKGTEDDYESEQDSTVPSRHPGYLPSKTESENSFQGNIIHPGQKLPSRRPSDKFDDYNTYTEDNSFNAEGDQPLSEPDKYRPVDKSTLRYPIPSVSSTYDPLSNQYVKSQAGFDQQKLDNDNRQVTNKFPSKLPGTKFDRTDSSIRTNVDKQSEAKQPLSGISTDKAKSYDMYNQNQRRPQVTATFASQTDDRRLPGKISSFAQNVRKPFEQQPNEINQYTANKSNIDQGPIFASEANDSDTNVANTVSGYDQYSGRPISNQRPQPNDDITRPSDHQEAILIPQGDGRSQLDDLRFTVPGKVSPFDQHISRPKFTQRPGQINYYASTTRPSTDQKLVFTSQNGSELENSQTFVPGTTYQNIKRPGFGQRLSQQNKYITVKPIEQEIGYEYKPPQRKFDDMPKLRHHVGQNKNNFDNKGEVRKPFVTPDVVHHEQDYEDVEESIKQSSPSPRPGQYSEVINRPLSPQEFEVYSKQNGPAYHSVKDTKPHKNIMETSELTKISNEPNKYSTIGSTRLPTYEQTQTTAGPDEEFVEQIEQQFEPFGTDYQKAQNIPQETARPPHKGTGYFVEKDKYRTGIVPSTTHIPPQSTRFEITQPIHRPGQQFNQYTSGRKDYNFMPTTKMPYQGSSRFDIESSTELYQQTPSGSLYQTTYKPMMTNIPNTNNKKVRPDSEIISTVRPGSQISTVRPPSQVSSTTYRPGYFTEIVEDGKRPTDAFGRPLDESNVAPGFGGTIIRPGTGRQNVIVTNNLDGHQPTVQFSNDNTDFTSEEAKPGLTTYGRPITPSDHRGDGTSVFPPYESSSSTKTIIGEDFSGPKQPQRYDPERGYYY